MIMLCCDNVEVLILKAPCNYLGRYTGGKGFQNRNIFDIKMEDGKNVF